MPPLMCQVRLPWCQADRILDAPQGTDLAGLLALLHDDVRGAEVFVFADGKMLLPGSSLEGCREVLVLPVLSGG